MDRRDSMVFYRSFYEAISHIAPKDQLPVYKAIFECGLNDNELELFGTAEAVFLLIKPQLEANKNKYRNGVKGGRPKNQTETETISNDNQAESKAKRNVNVNVNDNVNENVNETRTHKYGVFGWVRLTDEEHEKLLTDLGQDELDRCIKYIDESAESNGNKNKWKNWNLVIRKCSREGWGKRNPAKPTQSILHNSAPTLKDIENMKRLKERMG